MSTHTDTLRQMRPATVRGRAITTPLKPSSMTQSFFARGEEQEANGYENLAPDDPLLVPRELEFDSFDKIPRRRGSWFATAVAGLVVVAIGLVTWRSFYFLSRPGSSVAAAARAMVQAPPASQAPAPMSIAPAPQPPVSEPPPAAEPAPVTEPPAVTQPQAEPPPPAQPAPVAQPAPSHRHLAPQATADEPVHARRHAPLHGYVWSPEKHTLVPAEPAVEDQPPREDPGIRSLDGARGEEAQPQPTDEPTTPAPFRPSPSAAPVPQTSAPIID